MKNILVINNDTSGSVSAGYLGLKIAQKINGNLIVVSVPVKASKNKIALTAGGQKAVALQPKANRRIEILIANLKLAIDQSAGYCPTITPYSNTGAIESYLPGFIIKNEIWLVIAGINDSIENTGFEHTIQIILNKISVPVLLIPAGYTSRQFGRILYTVDLRYCRLETIGFLTILSSVFNSCLTIAHTPAKNLPDMAKDYAQLYFENQIRSRFPNAGLRFAHIADRDLKKTIDIYVNIMLTDLLVLVNHRYHFHQIIGETLTENTTGRPQVPMLIFPS